MKQQLLLASTAQLLRDLLPSAYTIEWYIESIRRFRKIAEGEGTVVLVMPKKLEWTRQSKGTIITIHEIDIAMTGDIDVEAAVDILGDWAHYFLEDAGPLEDFPCMAAATLNGAEAGFDPDELTNTPSKFFGGLRLTFWET